MESHYKVFISYAREDKKVADTLYLKLSIAGYEPFLDTKNILPGEDWANRIEKAINKSVFFLLLLSTNSINKRGFLQKEIRQALEMWNKMLDDDIYLIPVRIEECDVPDKLARFQWVDLFQPIGYEKLFAALENGISRRGLVERTKKNKQKKQTKMKIHQ